METTATPKPRKSRPLTQAQRVSLLKHALKHLGICQSELARRMGTSHACVSHMIRKQRPVTVQTLAKLLDVIEGDPNHTERLIYSRIRNR